MPCSGQSIINQLLQLHDNYATTVLLKITCHLRVGKKTIILRLNTTGRYTILNIYPYRKSVIFSPYEIMCFSTVVVSDK